MILSYAKNKETKKSLYDPQQKKILDKGSVELGNEGMRERGRNLDIVVLLLFALF